MRVVIVLVEGRPEEGTDDAGGLDASVREPQVPYHSLVGSVGERHVVGGEGLGMLGILLQSCDHSTLKTEERNEYGNAEIGRVLEIRNTFVSHRAWTYTIRTPLRSLTPSFSFRGSNAP